MRGFAAGLAAAALFARSALADVDPIVIKGSKFFYKTNGTQFFIQGVAYQQDYTTNSTSASTSTQYTDPLADETRCSQDIPLMQAINTNTIRVYAIDPKKDHSKCMQMLIDAGIYIVADLSQPGLSINRDSPAWTSELYTRYTSVIDALAPYNNVIGFFAGNEVSNNLTNTGASAFVKAAVRDMKSYIKTKNYRQMYVGYATNDDDKIRADMAAYFNCGDAASAIDFWGYNIYSWCGDSSFTESGYDQRVKEFESYSVPSFFAEYGCNTVKPRKFTEVGSIFGSDMTGTFSGGILYMYFQEANDYGLVQVSGGSASKLDDYDTYSSQMAQIKPSGVNAGSYNPSNTAAACPSVTSGVWEAKASPLPPVANGDLCTCMQNSLSCVVKSTVDEKNYGTLFSQVCGYGSSCAGIKADAFNGTYGAYGMCSSAQQLSFAFDRYYKSQNSAATACDFGGNASLQKAQSASGSCATLISQAGTAGTGSVTAAPTSSGTKKASAGAITVPRLDMSLLALGAYVTAAGFFGMGMILL